MATKKKTSAKKSAGRRSGPADSLRFQVIVAGIVLTVLSLAALYMIRGPQIERRPGMTVEQVADELGVEIDSLLLRNGLAGGEVDRHREPGLLRYAVRGPVPAGSEFDRLLNRLRTRIRDIDEKRNGTGNEVAYYWQGTLVAVLAFEPQERPLPPPFRHRPRLAIIMDDLGRSMAAARQLVELDLHVTFSILPGEGQATAVARFAEQKGQEVLLHVPMEPHDYPQTNPGRDALLLGQPPQELRRRLTEMLERVPSAVGANNHMGSRFTEYADGMETVLELLHERGLFFVDSRTSARSVARRTAQRAAVPSSVRDMFLDNVAEVEAIRREIRKLVVLAKRQGQAVGICHPYPETLAALHHERERLRNGEVELVFVSALVE